MTDQACSGPECDRLVKSKGMCGAHAEQVRRGGDLKAIGSPRRRRPADARFFEKVEQVGDCWMWTANKDKGYGGFLVAGHVTAKAHRWSYEFLRAEIPEGLHLDHLCHDSTCWAGVECPHRACVNPWHLEPVTPKVNIERGASHAIQAAMAAARFCCGNGHEWTPENTYIHRGKRYCRACRADSFRRWRHEHPAHHRPLR